MNMGVKLGMDPKILSNIMSTSTGRCWSVDTYNPVPGVLEGVPASNNYEGGFGSQLMLKDLGLALDAGGSVDAALPLGRVSQAFYQSITDKGAGGRDFGVSY